jgi:phosphoribosylamine--glycine ligase
MRARLWARTASSCPRAGAFLSVVATGAGPGPGRERAYGAVERIRLKGSHHRTDIALAAQRGEILVEG